MDKFILITHDKMRFVLTPQEYKGFMQAVTDKAQFVIIQGAFVGLQLLPSITPFPVWYAAETERLAVSGKRLCHLCACVMAISDRCRCWPEMGVDADKNAFIAPLPESIQKMLAGAVKPFPQVNPEDSKDDELRAKFHLPHSPLIA